MGVPLMILIWIITLLLASAYKLFTRKPNRNIIVDAITSVWLVTDFTLFTIFVVIIITIM